MHMSQTYSNMKLLNVVKLSSFIFIVLILQSVDAVPAGIRPQPLVTNVQPEADWWRTYLALESHKQPPTLPVVLKSNLQGLPQHFRPYQERLVRLDYLKR